MDGTTVASQGTMAAPDGYTVATIEDFDGDGLADLVWTNAKGKAILWQGIGDGFVSQQVADGEGTAYVVPAGYKVQMNRVQGVVNAASSTTSTQVAVIGTH